MTHNWKQEPIGRFLFSQLIHTMLTLSVLALLLVGARQVGALDDLLSPTAQSVGLSATTINYQGRLADENGTSLDGQYDLKFAIYDAAEGGVMVWPSDSEPELHEDVSVSDGLFSVGLGSRTSGGVPTHVWSGDRYLQVWVESEELAPRELLHSVPIAGMALTVPDGAITRDNLDFHVPQLLGQETCNDCGRPVESGEGWVAVKGSDTEDILEVAVTTQGGNILVQMTSRYEMDVPGTQWCHILVLQNGSSIKGVHLDGSHAPSDDFACSGSYLFTDLDAGTYTFRARAWIPDSTTSVTWKHQRQIVVYEF